MKDRIKNGTNLLEDHVFQFDFLNDDFTKLPLSLQKIINDPEKRKKLVIYINPPYAEASSYGTESIPQVANETKIFHSYKNIVGAEAMNELFAQFFIRIHKEIPDSILASFSKLKYITSGKFTRFMNYFNAEYKKGFICKSDTFDNVTGKFPIGFLIWNLANKKKFEEIETDIFLNDKEIKNCWKEGIKKFHIDDSQSIADWRTTFYNFTENPIGYVIIVGPSMQSNNNTFITNHPAESYIKKGMVARITASNLIEMSIYLSVRLCIEATWLNDRDQFLYPNESWKMDIEFQNDCLAYTLFSNNIQAEYGTNHWIPFTETEVNAREGFDSHFMTDFMKGKINYTPTTDLFNPTAENRTTALAFSDEAMTLFAAGRALWKYYHTQPDAKVNAALYDIREHFQGRNEAGKMNNKSEDAVYTKLIGDLRFNLKILAKKLAPKVYAHGFLKV